MAPMHIVNQIMLIGFRTAKFLLLDLDVVHPLNNLSLVSKLTQTSYLIHGYFSLKV